jgi:hypothetical protein
MYNVDEINSAVEDYMLTIGAKEKTFGELPNTDK